MNLEESTQAQFREMFRALQNGDTRDIAYQAAGITLRLSKDTGFRFMLHVFMEGNPADKRTALKMLGNMHWFPDVDSSGILDTLLACFDIDKEWRAPAITALKRYILANKRPDLIERIRYYLFDESAWIRVTAIDAIDELRDKASVPYLIQLISDEEGSVSLAARNALAAIGSPEGVLAVQQWKKSQASS